MKQFLVQRKSLILIGQRHVGPVGDPKVSRAEKLKIVHRVVEVEKSEEHNEVFWGKLFKCRSVILVEVKGNLLKSHVQIVEVRDARGIAEQLLLRFRLASKRKRRFV